MTIFAQQRNVEIINQVNSTHVAVFNTEVIERVFINLIYNAIKHSKLNTTIEILSELHHSGEKDYFRISIIDHGHGIPIAIVDNIFAKYWSK